MTTSERSLLLESNDENLKIHASRRGLSISIAAVFIIDVFGVFPLVTTPKAIIQCGFYGIVVVIITISLLMYTAVLLGECWLIAEKLEPNIKTKNRYPFAALAEMTWGKWMTCLTTFLLDLSIFFAGIPNLIVAAQNLQLLGQRLTNGNFDFSYCYWMILIGTTLCPFLWLGSPKDMQFLCMLSASLVVGVFILVIGCIAFDSTFSEEPPSLQIENSAPLWNYMLTAYGILIFQFDIHPTVLTIQVDMLQKNKLNVSIYAGFIITFSMFAIVTICASIKYGEAVRWSLLETLPTSPFLHLAAFLVIMQLSLTSAIGNSALYQHVEDCMGVPRNFNKKRCIIRSSLMIFATILAECVPRFDLIMSMIGTTLTGPIAFVLPPLFHLKILGIQEEQERLRRNIAVNLNSVQSESLETDNIEVVIKNKKLRRAISLTIAVVGVISIVATTYLNVVAVIQYGTFSKPCIYNLTMYLVTK